MRYLLFLLSLISLSISCDQGQDETDWQHVPSPDWSKQVIYFVMTDRFADGDPGNNDQGMDEYRPKDNGFWNGGDIRGLIDNLDYIQGLGATALWITPPVDNQEVHPTGYMSGYHGYWQRNIMEVDAHLGTLEDYKELSRELHKRGMYLVQDIVVNHMGDFWEYLGDYNPDDLTQNYEQYGGVPTQEPFNLNDPNNPEHVEAGIYHFTPELVNYDHPEEKLTHSLMLLDDLQTENPTVREELRKSFAYWIEEVGVDAYRFDTPLYVEKDFWNDFLYAQGEHPGMKHVAKEYGMDNFFDFGETWIPSEALKDEVDKEFIKYLGTKDKPGMSSILNFSLHSDLQRVFSQGAPTHYLSYRMDRIQGLYPNPELLVTFIDNHDMARFLNGATYEQMELALFFLYTIPGIPVIYYGTEQEFTQPRPAMFAEGSQSGDKDHFDTESRAYKFIAELGKLRSDHAVLSQGNWEGIADEKKSNGIFAYRMHDDNEELFVLMNTSSKARLMNISQNDFLGEGEQFGLELIFDNQKESPTEISTGSEIQAELPAYYAGIFRKSKDSKEDATPSQLSISDWSLTAETLQANGVCGDKQEIFVAIDGQTIESADIRIENGQWNLKCNLNAFNSGLHQLSVFSKDGGLEISPAIEFELILPKMSWGTFQDPSNDDNGPNGKYTYPTHASFKDGLMDFTEVQVSSEGSNMDLIIKMRSGISKEWNPLYGFDHLQISLYLDLPDRSGTQILPFRNTSLSSGEWDYHVSLSGFNIATYSSEGASENYHGMGSEPVPQISTDEESGEIRVRVPAASIGSPESLDGLKLYMVSYDSEGEGHFRPIKPEPDLYTFGGAPADAAKIMDDLGPVELRRP